MQLKDKKIKRGSIDMWNEEELDEILSRPTEALIEDMKKIKGDIMILGAGGKVGPTLSLMAQRACLKAGIDKKIIAVSRFTDPFVVDLLERENVTTITADLTDEAQIQKLPQVDNIIYMAGRKFGTAQNASETWLMNVAVPYMVAKNFQGKNFVVFSTGNVYPFTDANKEGADESVSPNPVGEYGMSSLGRERMFEYAAKKYASKVLVYRLNYAVDLRYGVLFDLAKNILEGTPISLTVPYFNCVWQHYANEVAIRALLHTSEEVNYLNVTGAEKVSVKETALALAKALGKEVVFENQEGEKALLSNATKCQTLFGTSEMTVPKMIDLQAKWLLNGGRILNKPTHFEERRGKY